MTRPSGRCSLICHRSLSPTPSKFVDFESHHTLCAYPWLPPLAEATALKCFVWPNQNARSSSACSLRAFSDRARQHVECGRLWYIKEEPSVLGSPHGVSGSLGGPSDLRARNRPAVRR
jgi:hypothetical protein